jgi:hypothetical protein
MWHPPFFIGKWLFWANPTVSDIFSGSHWSQQTEENQQKVLNASGKRFSDCCSKFKFKQWICQRHRLFVTYATSCTEELRNGLPLTLSWQIVTTCHSDMHWISVCPHHSTVNEPNGQLPCQVTSFWSAQTFYSSLLWNHVAHRKWMPHVCNSSSRNSDKIRSKYSPFLRG